MTLIVHQALKQGAMIIDGMKCVLRERIDLPKYGKDKAGQVAKKAKALIAKMRALAEGPVRTPKEIRA
jgi:hypothetical protein